MSNNSIKMLCNSNVIPKEKLREVQRETLNKLSGYLSATYGPMSSTTQIITGNNKETILSNYSKDGLKVLKHIIFDQPLEMAIQSEIEDVARFVEKQVGDGTTSSVIMSTEIFNNIADIEAKYPIPPRVLIKKFNTIVDDIKDRIKDNGRDITLDDIYDICMISTNGNEEVSTQISDIYEEYGFDVNIDVGTSNDHNSKVKIYDGLMINEGYSDPAYINNNISNTCDIHNARVYAFKDAVDTPEMINFMEKILVDNIFSHAKEPEEMIPTVIITPKLTIDASGLLTKLVSYLYEYNKDNMQNQKPPVLLITNITGTDTAIYNDIARLCKCRFIQKYIDPKNQKEAQEKGEAPTLDNITEWYGECELVSADSVKTKFINPKAMIDENDNTYDILIEFLKAEIKKATDENEDIATIGLLKKRLRALEANMIEYLVGGISVSDRDSLKDLVEDAVKNCSSAAENGVGYAANFEGLRAIDKYMDEQFFADGSCPADDDIDYLLAEAIDKAYFKAAKILYGSAVSGDFVEDIINQSLENNAPFNVMDILNIEKEEDIREIAPGLNVLCSINTDIEILDAISKIVTLMVTSNQSLVQVPALNRY